MIRETDDGAWPGTDPCPLLPVVDGRLSADWTRRHGRRRDGGFYLAALEYAQSLWMEGKPAQAVLQLNKAWSAEMEGDEEVLARWPPPYRVLEWMLVNRPEGRFLGNPVRHFQHLATRVSGRDAVVRSWRAWACYHISKRLLPEDGFPPDLIQIERERLRIPDPEEVIEGLRSHGWRGEAELAGETISGPRK